MPRLRIETDRGLTPPADPTHPEVTVWHDNDGAVAAYGHTVGGDHWLHLPGLVSFRFAPGREEITAVPVPSATRELVTDAYRRVALPMALQAAGLEVLHSSAVLMSPGVVALCAVSTVGKSTVAYALGRRGHPLWADDAVAFEIRKHGAAALPLPFEIQLRRESRAFFGRERTAGAAPDGNPNGCPGSPLRPTALAAVCLLSRLPSRARPRPVELRRLTPSDAFSAALAHAYCFDLDDVERRRRMLEMYLELAERVPIFELRFENGLDHLPAMVQSVEEAVDGLVAASP
jgi:hypothetical protein